MGSRLVRRSIDGRNLLGTTALIPGAAEALPERNAPADESQRSSKHFRSANPSFDPGRDIRNRRRLYRDQACSGHGSVLGGGASDQTEPLLSATCLEDGALGRYVVWSQLLFPVNDNHNSR